VKSQSEKSARGTTPLDDDGASAMTSPEASAGGTLMNRVVVKVLLVV